MPLSEKRTEMENLFVSDMDFNQVYPLGIRVLARRHWTPLIVAKKAADFLAAQNDVRILDIGSGVGKFCLAAASHRPDASYYGVEQRKSLISHAEAAKSILGLENVVFINGNFTQLDFGHYDHFYFYNSFYENLSFADKIDDNIDYSRELYNYYNRYLYKQLDQRPSGTRLASYHSLEDEMPPGYHVVGVDMEGLLKFWVKI